MTSTGRNDPADVHILLARYLSREADANDILTVETWIAEKPENRKYFDQLQFIWTESKKPAYINKPDVKATLKKFRERTVAQPAASPAAMRWLKVAALVLVIAAVAAIIKLTTSPQIRPPDVLKFSADNVAQTDTLPDGSIVQLQPHAELIYPAQFVKNQRNVELKGDAYFSVLHDARRPFQISVSDIKVTVLGTSFKISGRSGDIEVVVITGIVRVTKKERSMSVFPHEKLIVAASGGLWIKQSDTVSNIQIQLPKKTVRKPSNIKSVTTKPDSSVDDYTYHRQVMALIINDLLKERLVKDKESIVWIALTDSVLILNGKTQPEILHQKLKTKYHVSSEAGYYYGPVQITGKGYFFDHTDFNQ